MGFLSGTTTFDRYWITDDPTEAMGPDHLKTLGKFKIGQLETVAMDAPNVGFYGGAHLLDTKFDLEKNVIGDALHFGIRIDSDQVPAALRNAWLQMELLPLTVDNPSGKPTKAQRDEAKELVEARCEAEAATGKFRRMKAVHALWDGSSDVLYLGSTSANVNEVCVELIERAFGLKLEKVTSGRLAMAYATEYELLEALYNMRPSTFATEQELSSITWWNGMSDNYDYVGNEFLLWLWWYLETQGESLELADGSSVSGLFARTLSLDCPLGESGKETISSDSPVVLPEAKQGIQSGKLPRKAGLMLVRNDEQYELTLQAETFAVSGGKITKLGDDKTADVHERVTSINDFAETLDLLFDVFCERRLGKAWKGDLKSLREWLGASNVAQIRKPAA